MFALHLEEMDLNATAIMNCGSLRLRNMKLCFLHLYKEVKKWLPAMYSISWRKVLLELLTAIQVLMKLPHFMEPDGSIRCSEDATLHSLVFLPLSYVQIFSSAPCPQRLPVYVLSLV
jgi:hypothetical protein